MSRRQRIVLVPLLCFWMVSAVAQSDPSLLENRSARLSIYSWSETSTPHFNIYSCAPPQDVYKLAAKLEQFCKAYSLLAGTQAVASPPTVVMAFPDHESM